MTSAFGLELPWGEQTLNPVCVCVGTVHVDMCSIYQGLLLEWWVISSHKLRTLTVMLPLPGEGKPWCTRLSETNRLPTKQKGNFLTDQSLWESATLMIAVYKP